MGKKRRIFSLGQKDNVLIKKECAFDILIIVSFFIGANKIAVFMLLLSTKVFRTQF